MNIIIILLKSFAYKFISETELQFLLISNRFSIKMMSLSNDLGIFHFLWSVVI